MLKSTVLEIIRSFTTEDIRRFEDFLKSPFFNKNSNAIRLFSLIKKYSSDFDNLKLGKENLWQELFPGKTYNYGTMKNLIFELKKLAVKYIAIDEIERNKLEEDEIIIRALGKRNVLKFFIAKVNEVEKKYSMGNLRKLNIEFEDYFSLMFKVIWMKHSYLRAHNSRLAKDEDLNAYSALMAGSFLIYISMYYNNILAQTLDFNFLADKNAVFSLVEIFKNNNAEKIIKVISKYSESHGKIIELHWLKIKVFLKDSSEEDFYRFRNKVYENAGILPNLTLKGFLFAVVNSANNLDSPKINVSEERIQCLKILMNKKMLAHDDGRIYVSELLRYFWSAGNLNEFEVIEKLIKDYISKSSDENRDNVMNTGEIFFKIRDGKYSEALELISRVVSESFMMKVNLRMLKTRCFYFIDDYESFLYERDSLNHFLKSSKSLSDSKISQLKDFFEKINRMFRLKQKFDKADLSELKKEISSNINYPVWMKEELEKY